MQTVIRCLIILSCTIALTACGFHLRNSRELPAQLHHIHLKTSNTDSQLHNQIAMMLKGLHVQLAKHANQAPIQLRISHVAYNYTQPNITATGRASSYVATLNITATIINNKNNKVIIGPRVFTNSQTILLNANQIVTPTMKDSLTGELNREVINLLYYWLISDKVKNALNKHAS